MRTRSSKMKISILVVLFALAECRRIHRDVPFPSFFEQQMHRLLQQEPSIIQSKPKDQASTRSSLVLETTNSTPPPTIPPSADLIRAVRDNSTNNTEVDIEVTTTTSALIEVSTANETVPVVVVTTTIVPDQTHDSSTITTLKPVERQSLRDETTIIPTTELSTSPSVISSTEEPNQQTFSVKEVTQLSELRETTSEMPSSMEMLTTQPTLDILEISTTKSSDRDAVVQEQNSPLNRTLLLPSIGLGVDTNVDVDVDVDANVDAEVEANADIDSEVNVDVDAGVDVSIGQSGPSPDSGVDVEGDDDSNSGDDDSNGLTVGADVGVDADVDVNLPPVDVDVDVGLGSSKPGHRPKPSGKPGVGICIGIGGSKPCNQVPSTTKRPSKPRPTHGHHQNPHKPHRPPSKPPGRPKPRPPKPTTVRPTKPGKKPHKPGHHHHHHTTSTTTELPETTPQQQPCPNPTSGISDTDISVGVDVDVDVSSGGQETGQEEETSGGNVGSTIVSQFSCKGRRYGLFADVRSGCRVFVECVPQNSPFRKERVIHVRSFIFTCPPHTRFDQRVLACVHVHDSLPCHLSPRYYRETEEKFASSSTSCPCKGRKPDQPSQREFVNQTVPALPEQ